MEVLGLPVLADVLRRLGICTLGRFGELDEASVLARFGSEGGFAHRLARGLDERPLALGNPPADLTVSGRSTHLLTGLTPWALSP